MRDFIPYPCTRCDKLTACPDVPRSYRPPEVCAAYPAHGRRSRGRGKVAAIVVDAAMAQPAPDPAYVMPPRIVEVAARMRRASPPASAILWLTDRHGAAIHVSDAWAAFTGYSVSAALGAGWAIAVHQDDALMVRSSLLRATERQEPWEARYRLRRADGTWAWVIASGMPALAADGQFLGLSGSVIAAAEPATLAAG